MLNLPHSAKALLSKHHIQACSHAEKSSTGGQPSEEPMNVCSSWDSK